MFLFFLSCKNYLLKDIELLVQAVQQFNNWIFVNLVWYVLKVHAHLKMYSFEPPVHKTPQLLVY